MLSYPNPKFPVLAGVLHPHPCSYCGSGSEARHWPTHLAPTWRLESNPALAIASKPVGIRHEPSGWCEWSLVLIADDCRLVCRDDDRTKIEKTATELARFRFWKAGAYWLKRNLPPIVVRNWRRDVRLEPTVESMRLWVAGNLPVFEQVEKRYLEHLG